MKTNPTMTGVGLFFVGLLVGGIGTTLHLSSQYNSYVSKYGGCVMDYNKLSLKMLSYQTASIQETADLTHELLVCKQHLVGTAYGESEP